MGAQANSSSKSVVGALFTLQLAAMQRIIAFTFFALVLQIFDHNRLSALAQEKKEKVPLKKTPDTKDPCLAEEYAFSNYDKCCTHGGYKKGERAKVCKKVAQEAKKRREL